MNYPDIDDLLEGKFTDGDPIKGIAPSVDSANYMNAVYDELIAVIQAGGLNAEQQVLTQVSASIEKQIYGQRIFTATGTANDLILTSNTNQTAISELVDYDQIKVAITHTNTAPVTISLDDIDSLKVANITMANQLFSSAVATFTYLDGSLHLTEQINPKTGNNVLDIAKLYTDTVSLIRPNEYVLDGSTLNRIDHPIAFAIISASSNYIDQATKDANLNAYAGYYGDGDGSSTFTLPIIGGEFIRMYDDGRGVDAGREFGSFQVAEAYLSLPVRTLPNGFSYNGSENNYELSITATDDFPGNTSLRIDNRSQETRPRNIAYYGKTRL